MATNDDARDVLARCVRELDTWIAVGDGEDVGTISNVLGELQALRATGQLCTAEERAVLDATRDATLNDDDPDADPLEPQEHGEDCYLYTDDQFEIARLELARRAKGGAP